MTHTTYLSLATCWEVLHVRNIRQLDVVTSDRRANLAKYVFTHMTRWLTFPCLCSYFIFFFVLFVFLVAHSFFAFVIFLSLTSGWGFPGVVRVFIFLCYVCVSFCSLFFPFVIIFVIFLSLTWSGWGSPGAVRVQGATHSVWPYLRFNNLAICFWRSDLVDLFLAVIFW